MPEAHEHYVVMGRSRYHEKLLVRRARIFHDRLRLVGRHERIVFPVYDEEKKKFVGIVHMFDVLADPDSERKTVAEYMRPPQFIGDYIAVDHILPRMRVTRQPMVLVTNDRFEVIGLVTQEDVLDEVVGKI